VAALAGQVEVDLAERGHEGVGVAQGVRLPLAVLHLELVVQRQRLARHLALEEPGRMAAAQLDGLAAVDARDDARGRRPEGAHDHAAVLRVGAEQAVGIGQVAPDDRLDVGLDGHREGLLGK
jgi:hypothetical protein